MQVNALLSKALSVAGSSLSTLFGRGAANIKNLPLRTRTEGLPNDYPTLKDSVNISAQLLGNKGCNLSNLYALGFNVPTGFIVITKAYEEHVKQCGADKIIAEINAAQDSERMSSH